MRKLVGLTLSAVVLVGGGGTAAAQGGWDRGGYEDVRNDRYPDDRLEDARDDRWRRDGPVRTFNTPRLRGAALDICPFDVGVEGLLRGRCGMPVAESFCRQRGFRGALDAPHAPAGALGPTRQLRGGIVDHPWATGFRYITCG